MTGKKPGKSVNSPYTFGSDNSLLLLSTMQMLNG